jgi:hypothetical protein
MYIDSVDVTGSKLTRWIPAVMLIKYQVLSTHQEMIPAAKAIDEHAPDSVANDELLLPILKAFTQRNLTLHTTLSA